MTQQMTCTTDPVQRFPREIIDAIFLLLKFRDRIRLTVICRSWRQFLLDWPFMWKTLDDPNCDLGKDLLPFKRFIKHDAIKSLDIQKLNFDQQCRALSFIVDVGCTSLKTLRLTFRDIMLDRLDQVLQLSSHSIMQLYIQAQSNGLNILDRILQQCHHIKAIDYQQPGMLDDTSVSHYYDKLCFPYVEAIQVRSARAAKQVLHQFDMPNLKLLSISNHGGSLRNTRWPQLRVLRLLAPLWQEPAFQDVPIEHMPCLESIAISPILVTDEFLDAVGTLGNLKELHLGSPRDRSYNDPSWSEEAVIRMLQGHCRQDLRYLYLNYRELISDNVLDAIADLVTTGRLNCLLDICVSIVEQPSPEQLHEAASTRRRKLFPTETGLRRFALLIADSHLTLLKLRIYDDCSEGTIDFMRDKLGDEAVVYTSRLSLELRDEHMGADILGTERIQRLYETGRLLPRVYDDIYNELIEKCL